MRAAQLCERVTECVSFMMGSCVLGVSATSWHKACYKMCVNVMYVRARFERREEEKESGEKTDRERERDRDRETETERQRVCVCVWRGGGGVLVVMCVCGGVEKEGTLCSS